MVRLEDPIVIQRKLLSNEDISEIIAENKYHYVDFNNTNHAVIMSFKDANEELTRKLTRKLKELYAIERPVLGEYQLMRSVQEELMVRYAIADEMSLAVSTSHIPLSSKMNKFNKFFNCQDLVLKIVLYSYKQNYDALFGHMDKKFNQFWEFLNKLNKNDVNGDSIGTESLHRSKIGIHHHRSGRGGGSQGSSIARDILSNSGTDVDDDMDDEDEDAEDDDEIDENAGLTAEIKSELIEQEISAYWNCTFLKLFIYFRLNEFDKLVVEFWSLLMDSKPISGIDALQTFKHDFDRNGVISADELLILITLSILIARPVKDLKQLMTVERFVSFLQLYEDDSLVQLLTRCVDCSFVEYNQILQRLLAKSRFHTGNHERIETILRQKQYILILYSMSRIKASQFGELIGVDKDVLIFEVMKLVSSLQLPVDFDKNTEIFSIRQDTDRENLQLVSNLNELYAEIKSNNAQIDEFNSLYKPPAAKNTTAGRGRANATPLS